MQAIDLSGGLGALGLLLLVLVPIGCVVAFLVINTGGSWRGLLVGGLLGLGTLGVVAVLFVAAARLGSADAVSRPARRGGVGRSEAPQVQPPPSVARRPDPGNDAEVFQTHIDLTNWPLRTKWPADRHPTRGRAVEALAARVAHELREGAASCSRILVAGADDALLVRDAVRALRLHADRLAVTTASEDRAPDEETAVLAVSDQRGADAGALDAELAYRAINEASTTKRFTVAYRDAPWVVHDPDGTDPTGIVFVGRSAIEPSSDQARTIAERQALRRLAETVRSRLSAQGVPRGARWMLRGDRLDGLVEPIAVANGWRFELPFAQTFDSAHGKLSRVAVRSVPVNVVRISDQVAQRIEAYRSGWLMQGVAILVLGGLTYLGYRVLDGGTRGHFTWRLRLVSLATFVAATTATLLVVA